MKLVLGNDAHSPGKPDPTLLKTIAKAYVWAERLKSGTVDSVHEIAIAEGVIESYVTRVLRLGFLAPEIVTAIIEGRQPAELTTKRLILREEISAHWKRQLAGLAAPETVRGPR